VGLRGVGRGCPISRRCCEKWEIATSGRTILSGFHSHPFFGLTGIPPINFHNETQPLTDDEQITSLFQAGDRALISADVNELHRIYADDYIQYDESGHSSTRDDLIRKLTSGAVRFLSMTSTGRRIRLFGDFAIVHGSEEDVVEQDGRQSRVRYIYMDLVIKRDGKWQIVGSQLADGLKGSGF